MKKTFWRLQKKEYFMVAIELKKRLPELKNSDADTIASNIRGSNMEFYEREKVETKFLVRLTLPAALLTMSILFILLPINYIIVGYWGYKWKWLTNWLRSLGF